MAWTLGRRGSTRDKVAIEEIVDELRRASVSFDSHVLRDQLEQACANELVVREGDRFRFESPWLAEWLAISNDGKPVPIESKSDPNLVLNRYRTTERISHWGQAEVWKRVDVHKTHGTVILKITQRIGMAVPVSCKERRNISAESATLRLLRALTRVATISAATVIVLEYVNGENLRDLLRSGSNHAAKLVGAAGDLTTQVDFIEQIVAGLAACHAANVIHKDVKPANIVAQRTAASGSLKLWILVSRRQVPHPAHRRGRLAPLLEIWRQAMIRRRAPLKRSPIRRKCTMRSVSWRSGRLTSHDTDPALQGCQPMLECRSVSCKGDC